MASSSDRLAQVGFAGAIIGLSALTAGRTPLGLAFFLAASGILFWLVFRSRHFAETPLDGSILFFLAACLASTLYFFPSGFRGIEAFCILFAYALNFYSCVSLRDDSFSEMMLKIIAGLSAMMSLAIVATWRSDQMVFVFFPNKNLLCSFLNCGAISMGTLWLGLVQRDPESSWANNRAGHALCIAGLLIILLAEFRHYSIGGMVALACAALLFLRMNKIRVWIPLAAGTILLLCGALLFPRNAFGLILKMTSLSDNYRLQIWDAAWRAFRERPAVGWGLGNFGIAYDVHKLPIEALAGRYERTTGFAHNESLQIAVEQGILGLAAIAFMIYGAARSLKKDLEVREMTSIRSWALCCTVALAVHEIFDFNLHLPMLGLLFCFFCAHFVSAEARAATIWKSNTSISAAFAFAVLALFAGRSYEKFLQHRINVAASPDAALEQAMTNRWRIDPENHEPNAGLARFYFARKRFEESQSYYDAAIRRSPKNPFYRAEAGDIHVLCGRPALARPYYLRAVELEPFYAFAHFRLGEIDMILGNKEEAKTAFENAARIGDAKLAPESDYQRRLLEFDYNLARLRLKLMQG